MRFLVLNYLHHKNHEGLLSILKHLNVPYKFGSLEDINNYDVIYSPSEPIDTSKFPEKKFIFGPHFSVFPDNKIIKINNIYNNSIYIQPSDWASEVWKNMNVEKFIPIKTFCFPVNTLKFKEGNNKRDKVIVYFKRRKPEQLQFIEDYLKNIKIEYKVFDYVKRYKEEEYLSYLQVCKYGIIIGRHESQGFAIEEALSCNLPLLVWNTKYMSEEVGYNYKDIPCTTIPYWDNRCGEYFYEKEEFEKTFNSFINKLDIYEPRKYIEENLSVEKCSNNLIKLIDNI